MQMTFFWTGDEKRKGLPFIKWETIQKPKRLDGLGVESLIIENVGLLFKWWGFSKEGNLLWKILVCSVHNIDPNIPVLQQRNNRRIGSTWGSIIKVDE